MKIEITKGIHGDLSIPELIISAADFHSALSEKNIETAEELRYGIQSCINMYTNYCGAASFISTPAWKEFVGQFDRSGSVVFECLRKGDNPEYLIRWLSGAHEKVLFLNLTRMVRGAIR